MCKSKSQLYDEIYEGIDALGNLCKFIDGKCYRQRYQEKTYNVFKPFACCGASDTDITIKKCKYVTETGCSIKCLYCKIWFCEELMSTLPENILKKIHTLEEQAYKLDLIDFRKDKSFTFNRLKNVAD